MSGRLNPREYDLGELRDAVRHTHGRGSRVDRTDGENGDRRQHGSGDGESAESTDTGSTDTESTDSRASDAEPSSSTVDEDGRPTGRDRDVPVGRTRRRNASDREQSTEDPTVSTRDLELLAQLSREGVDRPYLARLPDEYSAQLEIFEWLEALLDTAGLDGALDALAYYESIGWLSERSHEHLVDFLDGLSDADGTDARPLTVDDHRQSLLYVARLAHRLH